MKWQIHATIDKECHRPYQQTKDVVAMMSSATAVTPPPPPQMAQPEGIPDGKQGIGPWYLKEDFSEPRLFRLTIYKKGLNSLTRCLFFCD